MHIRVDANPILRKMFSKRDDRYRIIRVVTNFVPCYSLVVDDFPPKIREACPCVLPRTILYYGTISKPNDSQYYC